MSHMKQLLQEQSDLGLHYLHISFCQAFVYKMFGNLLKSTFVLNEYGCFPIFILNIGQKGLSNQCSPRLQEPFNQDLHCMPFCQYF